MTPAWKQIDQRVVEQPQWRTIIGRTYELPDGKVAEYEIYSQVDVVIIVALTVDGRFILKQEFRPGPNKIVIDPPGGLVEPNEPFEVAARRELNEETGYDGVCKFIHMDYRDPYMDGRILTFLAENCIPLAFKPRNDELEYTEVVLMTFEELKDHLRTGSIIESISVFRALDHLYN